MLDSDLVEREVEMATKAIDRWVAYGAWRQPRRPSTRRREMRTSVQLEGPVIKRPIEDVFAFTSNLENSPLWGRTKETVKDSDGQTSVGTVFREEAKIMGRMVKHKSEVTIFGPPTEFSYTNRFENGTTERARITFAAVEGGTRMNPAAELEIGGIPQILAPFFSLLMERRMRSLLEKHKAALEPPDRSLVGAGMLIGIGFILLATAGMRFLIEIFPEGGLWTAFALFVSSLVSAGMAGILWKANTLMVDRADIEAQARGRQPGGEEH